MRPSTVQTSLFSFFSRDTILAFAPRSTASTRATESFQRNPNGGNSSSTAFADDTKRKNTIKPPGRIGPIARRQSKLTVQFGFLYLIFVLGCLRCRFPERSPVTFLRGQIAHAGQSGQPRSGATAMREDRSVGRSDYRPVAYQSAAESAGAIIFSFPSDTRVSVF